MRRSLITAAGSVLGGVALAAALVGSAHAADGAGASPVSVHVQRRDDLIVVDLQAQVRAPTSIVFEVLTDYTHMPRFLSTIKTSVVLSEHDGVTRVEQTGEARHGFLHFSFRTVRDIAATAGRELRAHLVEGDFKSYDMVTRLSERGGVTFIDQHGEYSPNTWIPPGIGPAAIEDETAKGYGELLAEIVKRRDLASPATSVAVTPAASPAP